VQDGAIQHLVFAALSSETISIGDPHLEKLLQPFERADRRTCRLTFPLVGVDTLHLPLHQLARPLDALFGQNQTLIQTFLRHAHRRKAAPASSFLLLLMSGLVGRMHLQPKAIPRCIRGRIKGKPKEARFGFSFPR
jgi:hypothetical protein